MSHRRPPTKGVGTPSHAGEASLTMINPARVECSSAATARPPAAVTLCHSVIIVGYDKYVNESNLLVAGSAEGAASLLWKEADIHDRASLVKLFRNLF
ncbi:2-octaprenyl-6-methoxy-1,4-benzoquinone methylase / demethylmenaquinone methyltransferase [Anopheles sinensis]|uniref:2-octaprenyl-6-methoxy-1,4-benzoquinone methylase / demethylmenaquinone methyltransferase n=1 Tax=Anopheles sinensis TaxID=74873 RepID=A0A084VB34_ANOSI|nr:2-octaprenyl-6-methoxy-1,4-benzoquinone methylase / demethylmenaquinone methyltransferase [Anopheles sinensis]